MQSMFSRFTTKARPITAVGVATKTKASLTPGCGRPRSRHREESGGSAFVGTRPRTYPTGPAKFCALAAARGHLNLLRWAMDNGAICDPSAAESAAEGGHLYVLKHVWRIPAVGLSRDIPDVCTCAARGGHLNVIQWMWSDNGVCTNADSLLEAAERGHLHILKWHDVHWPEQLAPIGDSLCGAAARGGHLGVLEWLSGKGLLPLRRICRGAATCGHLDVLEWALSRTPAGEFPWVGVCEGAASDGQVRVLQWSVGHGVETSDLLWHFAARWDRSEVLAWLSGRRTPDPYLCRSVATIAIRAGSLEALRWLAGETGSDDSPRYNLGDVDYAYLNAAQTGRLDVMEWLWSAGVPLLAHEHSECAALAVGYNPKRSRSGWPLTHPTPSSDTDCPQSPPRSLVTPLLLAAALPPIHLFPSTPPVPFSAFLSFIRPTARECSLSGVARLACVRVVP